MDPKAYLNDAAEHLLLAAGKIKEKPSAAERVEALVWVALGMEKLLKYVIASVNPALVLEKLDFESIVVHSHRDSISVDESLVELQKKASPDVITLRASIRRASTFNKGVLDNRGFIHALADCRDIAFHRPCAELDKDLVDRLLHRDFYITVRDICTSLGEGLFTFLGTNGPRLAELSERITSQENLQFTVNTLLEKHRALWADREKKPFNVELSKRATDAVLSKMTDTVPCKCPACGNLAVATLEPDFDSELDEYGIRTSYISNMYVESIHCQYCSLVVSEYDQLKYLDIDDWIKWDPILE